MTNSSAPPKDTPPEMTDEHRRVIDIAVGREVADDNGSTFDYDRLREVFVLVRSLASGERIDVSRKEIEGLSNLARQVDGGFYDGDLLARLQLGFSQILGDSNDTH